MQQATGLFTRRSENPKTVLAFFATVLGLVLGFGVGATTALATTSTSVYLIPWILASTAAAVVSLVIALFVVMVRDPSKLMLGKVTGDEYLAIQQHTVLGNSEEGERLVPVQPVAIAATMTAISNESAADLEDEAASDQ